MKNEILTKIQAYYEEVNPPVMTFDHWIRPNIISFSPGEVTITWNPKDVHINRYGAIHGGALAGLVDVVGAIATLSLGKRVVTTDMNLSFLKMGKLETTITAKAHVFHRGRSIMRTSVEFFNENHQLLVKAQLSFFVLGDLSLE
jgi:acyl-CoA thioesterase